MAGLGQASARHTAGHNLGAFFTVCITFFGLAAVLAGPVQAQVNSPSDLPPAAQPLDPRDRIIPPAIEAPDQAFEVPAFGGIVPPGAEETFFDLTGVRFEGASVYTDAQMQAVFADLISAGRIPLSAFYGAVRDLQRQYREDGYIVTRVVVPPQRMADGVATVQIVEGFISEVVVQGRLGPVRRKVEGYVRQLLDVFPVHALDIERYLLLANDIPGVRATGVLRADPGGAAGAVQLIVDATRDPYDGFFTVNNRGSKFTGPWAAAVGLSANSFSALGERTSALYYVTLDKQDTTAFGPGGGPEQDFKLIAYEARLGNEGTHVLLEASQGFSFPGASLAVLRIKNRVDRYKANVRHPIVRSRNENLYVTAEVEHVLERVRIPGVALDSRDKLTILDLGVDMEFKDTRYYRLRPARTDVQMHLRQGLPLAATSQDDQDRSRPEGSAVFTAVAVRMSREQPVSRRFSVYGDVAAQYAFDTLLSQAEFRVGGEEFGRGYDPSELAGERGAGAMVEVRYNGTTDWEAMRDYQLYAFGDAGVVENNDVGFEPREFIASAGVGARAQINTNFYLDLEYARTLSKPPGSRADREANSKWQMRFTAQF